MLTGKSSNAMLSDAMADEHRRVWVQEPLYFQVGIKGKNGVEKVKGLRRYTGTCTQSHHSV